MENKKIEHVTSETENKKLTIEEVNSVPGFENYSLREKQELINFVYNMSLVLFKSFDNEQSWLFQKICSC